MHALSKLAFVAVALLASAGTQALAGPVPMTSLSFSFDAGNEPSINFGTTTGTLSLGVPLDPTSFSGTTLLSTVSSGTSAHTVTYSMTGGALITDAVAGLFTFTDSSGSAPVTYTFDLAQVGTTIAAAGDSNELSLYLLGTLSGDGFTPTSTSILVDLTLDGNGNVINDSESLSNPPVANPEAAPSVPEPMSLALLAGGIAIVRLVSRRSAPAVAG